MTQSVLVDTGPLVAMLAQNDEHHTKCVEQARSLPRVLVTCWPVITEAAHLLRGHTNGLYALLSRLENGSLRLAELDGVDVHGMMAIADKYHDQDFDLADICLMYLADRDGFEQIFTIDQTDFSIYRTTNGRTLRLLPE